MPTQTSYPGVYIEEFTPAAPIEGVGTSTVGFIGTAEKGPIREPVRLHNWDAFKERFGDFTVGQPPGWLAPAVYGFFLNGGTDCFVVREGTAARASAKLLSRKTGSQEPVLIAEAIEEGSDVIGLVVRDRSALDEQLGTVAATLKVHFAESKLDQPLDTGPAADRTKAQVVSNAKFIVGERVAIEASGTETKHVVIKEKQGTKTLIFTSAVPDQATFPSGSIRSDDLKTGQQEVRVDLPTGLPAGFRLDQAVPEGATVRIAGGGKEDVAYVSATRSDAAGSSVILGQGLRNDYTPDANGPTLASLEFDVTVRPPQGDEELFELLGMHPDHPNYWGTAIVSSWLTLREPEQPPASPDPDPRPKAATQDLTGGAPDDRKAAWSGANGLLNDPDPALTALGQVDEVDIVCIPGATDANVQAKLVAHCENKRDRFAILDSKPKAKPDATGIEAQADTVRGSQLGFAALYYPWIWTANPRSGRTELWPPSGHIAGVYARTDARAGVHAAPANTNVKGALGLEFRLSDLDQGPLNLKGIDVLRTFPGEGEPVVWGARTTSLKNKYWQYVNIRRLFLFLEKSIQQNIRWAVFQPNNLDLWQQLRRVISDFLRKAWQGGALFGATEKEAFYVRIDEALNPESERALGRLHIEIGVAPTYPAEFVIVRIGIWQGGSAVSET